MAFEGTVPANFTVEEETPIQIHLNFQYSILASFSFLPYTNPGPKRDPNDGLFALGYYKSTYHYFRLHIFRGLSALTTAFCPDSLGFIPTHIIRCGFGFLKLVGVNVAMSRGAHTIWLYIVPFLMVYTLTIKTVDSGQCNI